jgi:hypothetical protein
VTTCLALLYVSPSDKKVWSVAGNRVFQPEGLTHISPGQARLRAPPRELIQKIQVCPVRQRREGFFCLKNKGIPFLLPSWKDISDQPMAERSDATGINFCVAHRSRRDRTLLANDIVE